MSVTTRRARALLSSAFAIVAATAAGCTSAATVAGMTVGEREIAQLPADGATLSGKPTLAIRSVTGGGSSLWGPNISDSAFEAALTASLLAAGLPMRGPASLRLDAELLQVAYSAKASNTPASVAVRYSLYSTATDNLVFEHTIKSGAVIPRQVSESVDRRAQLGLETAARDNILRFIGDVDTEIPDR